jgi:hypothetical protein
MDNRWMTVENPDYLWLPIIILELENGRKPALHFRWKKTIKWVRSPKACGPKLALTAALSSNRSAVLDEPTGGPIRRRSRNFIETILSTSGTGKDDLVSSHLLNDFQVFFDH